jgi:ADP-heptose:LPS heptosyltransferase
MTRTLVIQLGRLGDVIQTTPLLAELRGASALPRAPLGPANSTAIADEVDTLVLRSAHEPLLGFSAVANIITIPDALKPLDDAIACGFQQGKIPAEARELLADLQLRPYNRIINASHAPLGCWLAGVIPCTDPDARYGGVIRDRECLYLGRASAYRIAMLQFREHNLFNLVDLLRAAHGAVPPIHRPCLYANRSSELSYALPAGQKVALNPGASEPARCWPAENFAHIAEALSAAGFTPLLVGAPSDRGLCEKIQSTARIPISNFAGRTTIPEMARLLARCDLLVSADTGAAHLAAAVGTTVVGLYGATAWFAETAPYGDNHLILQTPFNAPMSTISPDAVLAAALNRLNRLSASELQHELLRQNQSAWETSIQPPSHSSDGDPLGGLVYRPLHQDSLAPSELLAQSLRTAFAAEFFTLTKTIVPRHPDACAVAPLAQIFEHMQALAVLCSESARTRAASSEVAAAARCLISTMETLRTLAAQPGWRPFGLVIHNIDWQLRMLPRQSPEQTFLAHAEAFGSACRILRRAVRSEANEIENDSTENETIDWTGSFTTNGREVLLQEKKRGDRCLVR